MAHSSGKPSTLYMSARTAALAREIEERTGQKAGFLLRQFVELYSRMILSSGEAANSASIAFALPALASWEVNAPSPLIGIPATRESSLDIWSEALGDQHPPASRVFLMGLTLEHPITNPERLWTDYLQNGGFLQVLIQGDLSGFQDAPRIIGAINPPVNKDRLEARRRTIEVLKRVVRNTETERVEIRNSGPVQMSNNIGLIFREDGGFAHDREAGALLTWKRQARKTIVQTGRPAAAWTFDWRAEARLNSCYAGKRNHGK